MDDCDLFYMCPPLTQGSLCWIELLFKSISGLTLSPSMLGRHSAIGNTLCDCFTLDVLVSLSCPGQPWPHFVAQAGTELATLLSLFSELEKLGLQACASRPSCLDSGYYENQVLYNGWRVFQRSRTNIHPWTHLNNLDVIPTSFHTAFRGKEREGPLHTSAHLCGEAEHLTLHR